jgi:hypothetical protein
MIKVSVRSLSVLLYIIIFSIPSFEFPVLVLYSVLIICFIIIPGKKLSIALCESVNEYQLILLLALTLFWNQSYNISFNADKGWISRFHKIIYPLSGNNVEIVPSGAKGYLLDSICNTKAENDYAYFETCFQTLKVKKGDSLKTSVYCYVSNDFDGNSVSILVKGAVYGNSIVDYKLFDSKGDELKTPDNLFDNGDFKLGTTYWLPNADSTTHDIIETPFGRGIRVTRTNGDAAWWSLQYIGRPIIYYAGHRYQIRFLYKIEKGNGMPFNIGWWVDDGNGFTVYKLPLKIRKIENGWSEAICSYRFNQTHYNLVTFLNSLKSNSIVDMTSVELKDMDRIDTVPCFIDQINKKGTWQKLTIRVPCKSGRALICFRISKNQAVDFRSLKGHVIFTGPEYAVIHKTDNISAF